MKRLKKIWHHVTPTLALSILLCNGASKAAAADPLFDLQATVATINSKFERPTVEQFLDAAPPAWRENFTFVYQSKSLQEASRLFPRALAFSTDGSVIVAFNGDSSQFGYDRVELAIVRPENHALEFRDVAFCKSQVQGPCRAVLSAANPEQCQACHSNGPHYIWQPYHTWDGVYGSKNDILSEGENNEAGDFAQFKPEWRRNSRYQKLVVPVQETASYPYRLNPETGLYIDHRANAHLTMAILKQQARTLAQKILLATVTKPDERTQLIRYLAACPGYRQESVAYPAIRALAAQIGLPFEDHWSLRLGDLDLTAAEVLQFTDGFMRLPGAILGFLLPEIPEYAALLEDKSIGYSAIIGADSSTEAVTERTKNIFASLDRIGPSYPELGYYNYLAQYVPLDKRVDKGALCAIHL